MQGLVTSSTTLNGQRGTTFTLTLNRLFARCAALLLGRSGQHAFHGGHLDVRGLVIAFELLVLRYRLGLFPVGQQLLGTEQASVGYGVPTLRICIRLRVRA